MSIFKIALPNKDIQDANIDNYVVNSLYPNPKIDTSATPPHAGVVSINWASNGLIMPLNQIRILFTLPHHYNYVPSYIASFTVDTGTSVQSGGLPFIIPNASSTSYIGYIDAYIDKNNFYVYYYSIDTHNTTVIDPFLAKVRYYIMAERGYDT